MNRRLLGITVLGDFIVSEGVEAVIANLLQVGATAVAINPTVTCAADENTGKFQPPADAGHSPRHFDRPLFGKHALWVRSGPSFHPRPQFYKDSPYRPRKANDLTDTYGGLIDKFIDACTTDNIDVYLQVGAAEPSGLRDEDRPRLPDGSLPQGRIADIGSLPSAAIRAYNRAYANDLVAAYPKIAGFRIDWPEYPCYTADEVFQDFSPHVAQWAASHGFDFNAIRAGVTALLAHMSGNLSNDDIAPLTSRQSGIGSLTVSLQQFPAAAMWLELKAALSQDLIRDWRAIVDSLDGGPKKLSVHAFPPPFSKLTGFDFAGAAPLCDSLSPKLYTMHWCLMVNGWGKWLMERNPNLDETLLTRALVNLLQLVDEESHEATLADHAYPQPDQPHPIGDRAQRSKIEDVLSAVDGRTLVFPLVHGYGPVDDFAGRFRAGLHGNSAGVWVNRYGYLSDDKLRVIADLFSSTAR